MAEGGPAAGFSLLLLDDSPVMVELLGNLLEDLGAAAILTAADGEEGLAVFDAARPKPDILICDLCMPGMDGVEFLRHMAERGFAGGVILFSGVDGSLLKAAERLTRAHGLNYLGRIEKPVAPDSLAAVLGRYGGAARRPGGREPAVLTPEEVARGLADGCIEVHFQPKVAVRDRRLAGVECLVRWRHPRLGLLPPAAFIATVEEQGLMDRLTLAVFRRAVDQQRAWREAGHQIKVSVNVSMDNLACLELPEIFAGIVAEAGLEPGGIVLELTESRLLESLKLGLDTLIRLRLKGFGLSIDDFGTGYSTLENLQQLPFTELKVDRSFVRGAAGDPAALAIIESSLRLARAFALDTVAEGVETEEDWNAVAALGCDQVQGYLVARPMPGAEIIPWLEGRGGNEQRRQDMGETACILTVDDDCVMQELYAATLGDHYRMRSAGSGEEALAAVRDERPDLVILDVSMPPGMDGYETCRRLKAAPETAAIPVIFLSGRDCIEDRLKGYEAGGEDYLIKPFDDQELKAKAAHLLQAAAASAQLREMASFASTTAVTAMTSLSELGQLLETMKRFSACAGDPDLAEALLAGLALYGLAGAVQIRSPGHSLTRTSRGEASPLESSVITQMAGMERIVHFKSRLLINYPRVSLLVHDMPKDDADRCGRLRDHLAMLAEAAEVRAEAIAAGAESRRRGRAIDQAIERITGTLQDIDRAQRDHRLAARLAVEAVTRRLDQAFMTVALTTAQEDYMGSIVREGMDELLNTQTDVASLQNRLSAIVDELRAMAEGAPQ